MQGDLIDRATGAQVQIDHEHYEIHEGDAFVLSRSTTIPVANDDEILIVTPNTTKWAHMTINAINDAALTMSLYEGTGLTTPTSLATSIKNRDRNSTVASGLTIGHTPAAGSGDGTLVWQVVAGASLPISGGVAINQRNEFILKQNTAYLLRFAGANGDALSFNLDWYEHINVI